MVEHSAYVPLCIIRHGPTDWTADKRLQGRTDTQLSDEGRDMVRTWHVPDDIATRDWICSPLERTQQTAEILARKPVQVEPRIIEMNYGDWEGLRLPDLRQELGQEMADNEARGLDFRPPGGESPRDVQERMQPWLTDLESAGVAVTVVAHHGIIRALYAMATGWNMVDRLPQKFRFGEMHHFHVAPNGQIKVDRLNESMCP